MSEEFLKELLNEEPYKIWLSIYVNNNDKIDTITTIYFNILKSKYKKVFRKFFKKFKIKNNEGKYSLTLEFVKRDSTIYQLVLDSFKNEKEALEEYEKIKSFLLKEECTPFEKIFEEVSVK